MVFDSKCEAGCLSFYGGEKKHHHNCAHYPESQTKMLNDALAENEAMNLALGDILSSDDLDWIKCRAIAGLPAEPKETPCA
jgi:hypothetical protein